MEELIGGAPLAVLLTGDADVALDAEPRPERNPHRCPAF
jgi:hypothetical protein